MQMTRAAWAVLLVLTTAACSQPAAAPSPTPSSPPPTSAPTAASSIQLTLAPDGNEARFRAREQLARRNLPSEAVGTTKDLSGTITLGPNGIVAEGSKVSVRLEALATDDRQRDRFIKSNTLQTQRFPTVEFEPKSATGLTWPLPTAGESRFQLAGDLTMHGVTKPSTWDVTAQFSPTEVTGKGATSVTLEQFGMEKPSVMSVLSIDDAIVLEIDFRAVR